MLVLVVVNKFWECDPLLAALLGEGVPPQIREQWPVIQDWPRARRNPPKGSAPQNPDPSPKPRAVFTLHHTVVEVWCVSDLLEHFPDESRYQSSSERKAERLPLVLQGRAPDLVVAVGTAAFPSSSENLNGSVVVGTHVFAHDGDPSNTYSRWAWTFDTLVKSALPSDAFRTMTAVGAQLQPRLLAAPRAPSSQRVFLAQHDLVSLGSVNVTDYAKYGPSDGAAVKAFRDAKTGLPAGSLETTHAVIRASLGDRFLFVSGIVDRLGHFDDDVGEIAYPQNLVGAHNAGVAIAWMLPAIDAI
jgi:hypothetical protein